MCSKVCVKAFFQMCKIHLGIAIYCLGLHGSGELPVAFNAPISNQC